MSLEKVLYTATATATGGRDRHRASRPTACSTSS